jgi:hypothetical protein
LTPPSKICIVTRPIHFSVVLQEDKYLAIGEDLSVSRGAVLSEEVMDKRSTNSSQPTPCPTVLVDWNSKSALAKELFKFANKIFWLLFRNPMSTDI